MDIIQAYINEYNYLNIVFTCIDHKFLKKIVSSLAKDFNAEIIDLFPIVSNINDIDKQLADELMKAYNPFKFIISPIFPVSKNAYPKNAYTDEMKNISLVRRGKKSLDSGYRHFVNYIVSSVSDHPITKGINNFKIEDELYLFHVFEEDINPILKSDYKFIRDNFYSATNALNGEMNSNEGWEHPDGSNIVGWTKYYKKSAITYLQFGDSVKSYENKSVRLLLKRSIDWVTKETKEIKKFKND